MLSTHFLKPRNLTVEAAAQALGLPDEHLRALVSGDRAVTPEMAAALAQFTRTSAEFWMRLQEAVDGYAAQDNAAAAG